MTVRKRVQAHNSKMLESVMTHDDLLTWAQEEYDRQRRWPTRRWRVEGAPVPGGGTMNSRLLTEKAAKRAHRQYGGRLVEAIPSRSAFTGKTKGGAHG